MKSRVRARKETSGEQKFARGPLPLCQLNSNKAATWNMALGTMFELQGLKVNYLAGME